MLPPPMKVCKYIDSRNHERSLKKVARLFKEGLDPRGIKTTPDNVYEPSFFISPIIRSLINQRQDVLNLCVETCKERSLKISTQDYISYLSHAARYYPDAITYLFDHKSQLVTGQTGQRTEAPAVFNFIEKV